MAFSTCFQHVSFKCIYASWWNSTGLMKSITPVIGSEIHVLTIDYKYKIILYKMCLNTKWMIIVEWIYIGKESWSCPKGSDRHGMKKRWEWWEIKKQRKYYRGKFLKALYYAFRKLGSSEIKLLAQESTTAREWTTYSSSVLPCVFKHLQCGLLNLNTS